MSDTSTDLGTIDPAGSRHGGRRSATTLVADLAVVGSADGDLLALDSATLEGRWHVPCDRDATSVVTLTPFAGGVLVGERSPRGEVRLHDAADGEVRWRLATAETVGRPTSDDRFSLPFVVDAVTAGDRAVVAARRYERAGETRRFEGVVLAFAPDGTVEWRARTDASPVALDTDGDRVAVAYNRCPGDHDDGLVFHDATTGAVDLRWDPEAEGDRRVGDVSLWPGGIAVASHADHRGYRLSRSGDTRWRVDAATPTAVDGDRVYAYPNHVHATPDGVVVITGNTYPVEGRETEARHGRATAAIGYTPDGRHRFTAALGGFASEIATTGRRLVVPVAQGFRVRDPGVHGLRVVDPVDGPVRRVDTEGVVTAVTAGDDRIVAVEEPVRYHDDGVERGAYRVHAVGTN
ncbi:PQQ-binding-like beta-propeller repeat protein [Haloplanus salilacus]|uniref:outer membrane protein assembly factor BamB family protein n=1 Tax=Haloplanus salilacus TaxID=2949994 RepID=UPI0030D49C68